jgi:hypothetical protein
MGEIKMSFSDKLLVEVDADYVYEKEIDESVFMGSS